MSDLAGLRRAIRPAVAALHPTHEHPRMPPAKFETVTHLCPDCSLVLWPNETCRQCSGECAVWMIQRFGLQ
jgi:hypothetical protein